MLNWLAVRLLRYLTPYQLREIADAAVRGAFQELEQSGYVIVKKQEIGQ